MVILAAPYNETLVLETINHQAFYNSNLGPFLAGLAVQMFMMGVLCTYPDDIFLLNSATYGL